jgi:hypothetical protein
MRMKLLHALAMLLTLPFLQGAVARDDLPWKFGMSPDEVRAVTRLGPYNAFRNGDLETYHGVFEGHEENFQFFFKDGKLDGIGIYLYEGTDAQVAGARWLALRSVMARRYGSMRTPDNVPPVDDSPQGGAPFVARALEIAQRDGRAQMWPLKEPDDVNVFARLGSGIVEGDRMYFVIFKYTPPTAP